LLPTLSLNGGQKKAFARWEKNHNTRKFMVPYLCVSDYLFGNGKWEMGILLSMFNSQFLIPIFQSKS